jgi:hypothetical protein
LTPSSVFISFDERTASAYRILALSNDGLP